jgi:hypothetical protein
MSLPSAGASVGRCREPKRSRQHQHEQGKQVSEHSHPHSRVSIGNLLRGTRSFAKLSR